MSAHTAVDSRRAGKGHLTGLSRLKCSKLSGEPTIVRPSSAELGRSKDFIAGYFGVINSVLNQGGVACVQVITIPESRFDKCELLSLAPTLPSSRGLKTSSPGSEGWAWWLTPSDQQEVDFIRKWIFPGGFLPTVSFATEAIRVGAENGLVVDSVSNIGVSRALSHFDLSHLSVIVGPYQRRLWSCHMEVMLFMGVC